MKRFCTLMCAMLSLTSVCAQRADNYPPTRNASVKFTETNLPIVFINVDGKMIQREERITAKIKIIDNGEGKTNYADLTAHPDQKIDYEGYISIKYRGNSSFNSSEKKPYGFKTIEKPLEEGGKKVKVKLLGLGKDNDWVLLAPFSDKSMVRDVLTFELGRPYFDWVPTSRHCEVVLDGKYYGIYILTERPGKGKQRLNLHDPGEDGGDLTGDWRVEIDRDDEEHYYRSKYHPYGKDGLFNNSYNITYQYDDPEYDDFADLPEGTEKAIQKSIDDMEDCFASENYKDPTTGYRKYIDVTSFIDYMLSTEFSYNIDGYRLSSHMYKYSETRAKNEGLDSRWKTTLWDFNIAYGNANYNNGASTNLWQYDFNSRTEDPQQVPFWWKRLLDDPAYQKELKARWAQYRQGAYSNENIEAKIDSMTTRLTSGGAMARNEEAWGMFGRQVWPNAYVGNSYDDEVTYLKQFIRKRLRFMDRQLLPQTQRTDTRSLSVTTGFTKDVVVEALPAQSHMSGAIDVSGNTYYSVDVKTNGGLPTDGKIVSPSGVGYQLAGYAVNNALVLSANASATLMFAEPVTTNELFVLSTSANGSSMLKAEPVYSDGSRDSGETFTVPDWSVRTPTGDEALSGLGRIYMPNDEISADNHFCLFENSIMVKTTKTLAGVCITNTGSARATVMGFAYADVQASGIKGVTDNDALDNASHAHTAHTVLGYYNLDGVRLAQPQKGLNIVHLSNGTVKKVVVK